MRIRWRGFELPTRVLVDEETKTGTYAQFMAEPFERGYGITVGNSLRRVLLSSIEGAAPICVRFDQVTHEFTAVKGVYEDVTNIVLNLKGLLVKMSGDAPEVLKFSKKGSGPLTAGDLDVPASVTIVNPDMVIATLVDDNAELSGEITIAKGRGYKTVEELNLGEAELGVVPMDATFSPVRRTRWSTEDTRVGQMTNYDRLILEVWTDGTITPEEAMVEAASILRKHLNPFVKFFEVGPELEREGAAEEGVESTEMRSEDRELVVKLEQPVSILDPSVRAANCLAAEGIKTLWDLVVRAETDMLQVRNFGKTSLKEIKAKLADQGLSFGMDVPARESVAD